MPLSLLILGINNAIAQTSNDFFSTTGQPDIHAVSKGTLGPVIVSIINYFLGILGLIAVGFVIYAGILMVTAGGEEENVTKGRKIITYAAIGIVIILLSYTIVTFVSNALS